MAAYAALLSLNYIIEQLQHHPRPPISMNQNQVQSFIQNITFLQDFLEVYSHVRNEDVDRLQSCIAEAAYAAQDVIESHIVDQILVESTTHGEQIISVDFYQGLQKVIQDIGFIKKEAMEIKEKGVQKHIRSSILAATSSRSSSVGKITMVGFDDVLEEIMDKLTQRQSNRQIISIVGMGGIGKTTVAKIAYENPLIVQHFDIRCWATISQGYSVKEILLKLLCDQGSQESLSQMTEAELGQRLYQKFYGRRYLIMMDDLWSTKAWDELKSFFPENHCGSGIIITSRLSNLASDIHATFGLQMSFLNDDKSWELFCKTVFGEDSCPFELEETGKEIAKKCKGLPLSIVVIGGLLAKSEQTGKYWEYVAENLNSIVNLEDNERCLNLLYMSYNYLPVHLKPCFLYMGVFSDDDTIRVSNLIPLWVAEGFLKPISGKSLEEAAKEYLEALVDRNLILVEEWRHNGEIKLCKMHDLLRDLCLREAQKDKFLCVARPQSLNNFPHDINIQRHIAIHQSKSEEPEKNDYHYLPEIRDTLQSAPLVRSLIRVSLEIFPSPNFRLLRVLKALGKRDHKQNSSIESPFQLVNLRYLAFFFGRYTPVFYEIPSSVYLLWNLQTIIVPNLLMDIDIWKMPLISHVELMLFDIIDPGSDGIVLEKLHTLLRVRDLQCSEEIVKRIPNVKKLKISYDGACVASRCCLNNLGRLHKLETLNCYFLSKLTRSDLVQNLTFPHSLKKLTLENCGLHWEDMSMKIGSLPHLQVLKLGPVSCIGHEWETVEGQFYSLKFLKIAFCKELECWNMEGSHFPRLEHLILSHLKGLKEIPSGLGDISTLKLIEVDCGGSSAVVSAKKIAEEQDELGNQELQVRVRVRGYYGDLEEELQSMASHNFLVD